MNTCARTPLLSPLCPQEQGFTFDRVLGPGAAQVGVLRKGWEESGSPQASASWDSEWSSRFAQGMLSPDSEGCACVFLQEAEQELLTQVQPMLASVGQGYNIALLLQGQDTEAPRFVPQVRSDQHTGILMFKYYLGNLCLLTPARLGTA